MELIHWTYTLPLYMDLIVEYMEHILGYLRQRNIIANVCKTQTVINNYSEPISCS